MTSESEEAQKVLPVAIEELEEIVNKVEKSLENPEGLSPATQETYQVALTELSTVLGVLYRGKPFDPKELDLILRKVQRCFYEVSQDYSLPYEESLFSSHARTLISRAKREIYKLDALTPQTHMALQP